MSTCMCERDQTGVWKTFSQWELHSTKSWGHIAVLRTLRSIFNFLTVNPGIGLSAGKDEEIPPCPWARASALLRTMEQGATGSLIRAHVPRKVPPALQSFLSPAAFLWVPWHTVLCCRRDRQQGLKMWWFDNEQTFPSRPQQTPMFRTFAKGKCYFLSMLHLHYMNQKLAVNHQEPAVHSPGRGPSLQGRLHSCISPAASSSPAGCRH